MKNIGKTNDRQDGAGVIKFIDGTYKKKNSLLQEITRHSTNIVNNDPLAGSNESLQKYASDSKRILTEIKSYPIPDIIEDEINIIIRETRSFNLKFGQYGEYLELSHAEDYINKQKLHLKSISGKIGKDNRAYLHVSTLVVEKVLLVISYSLKTIETIFITESNPVARNMMMRNHKIREVYICAFNLTDKLEQMDMEYGYRYDMFSICVKNIRSCCGNRFGINKKENRNVGCLGALTVSFLIASSAIMSSLIMLRII